ncbi:hypothetical protein MPSEU_000986300 [Mayamaea pseudoterrestris]|nr:hypothetical protein MPSEU_000986300 [Mayamaea pseudoterrestris]
MARISRSTESSNSSSTFRWIVLSVLLVAAIIAFQQRIELQSAYEGLATSGIRMNQEVLTSSISAAAIAPPKKVYDFEAIGLTTGTDKVRGPLHLANCLKDPSKCRTPQAATPKCRTGIDHYYHTMYNARVGPLLAGDSVEPFQMLEIGFQYGRGRDLYQKFMPMAEIHSLEIGCLPNHELSNDNAKKHPDYQTLIDTNRLHCGDATDYDTLVDVWGKMRASPNAPPLKLVVDDGAHISDHMVKAVFFWFPRMAPGGLLVMEDIEPRPQADTAEFRLHFMPQVFKDIHYCGNPNVYEQLCFPTLHKYLQSVHCEMHICIFERNDVPAEELSKEDSLPPPHVFNAKKCLFGES